MDLSEKAGSSSLSEEMNGKYPDGASSEESHTNELKKSCSDCRTTKTPLWRGGPAGPKTLCNACGIRFRKKRRALMGLSKGGGIEKEKKEYKRSNLGVSVKVRLVGLGKQRMRKLGEEEEAAVLLMALSCGSVYA